MGTDLLPLPELANRINAEHADCMQAAVTAIEKAIEVGRLLAEAKAQVRHGEWESWVQGNCVFEIRQAQRYMRAFENRESIAGPKASRETLLTSLNGAIEAIAQPKGSTRFGVTLDWHHGWRGPTRLEEPRECTMSHEDAYLLFMNNQVGKDGIPCYGAECLVCAHERIWRRLWDEQMQDIAYHHTLPKEEREQHMEMLDRKRHALWDKPREFALPLGYTLVICPSPP